MLAVVAACHHRRRVMLFEHTMLGCLCELVWLCSCRRPCSSSCSHCKKRAAETCSRCSSRCAQSSLLAAIAVGTLACLLLLSAAPLQPFPNTSRAHRHPAKFVLCCLQMGHIVWCSSDQLQTSIVQLLQHAWRFLLTSKQLSSRKQLLVCR